MCIALRRHRIGVTEQTPDDGEAHPAGNEMRGVRVPVVMNAVVLQPRRYGDRLPDPFQVGDWLVWLATRKEKGGAFPCNVTHAAQQF